MDRNEELLEEFAVAMKAARRAARTVESRVATLRSFARRQEVDFLEARVFHMRKDLGRDGIAVSTASSERFALIAFYRFLVEEGYLEENPALRLEMIKVPKGKPRPYSPSQVTRLMTTGAYFRTRVMILLESRQGWRASEVAAAHNDLFDLELNRVKVFGKGGRVDYQPIHPEVAEIIPIMREQSADGWWFPARGRRKGSGHILGRSVSDLMTQAKRRAEIIDPKLTGHSLRHGFGTDLVRANVNLRVVQELMRHASLSTTQIYTGIDAEQLESGIGSLPAIGIPMTHSGRPTAPRANAGRKPKSGDVIPLWSAPLPAELPEFPDEHPIAA